MSDAPAKQLNQAIRRANFVPTTNSDVYPSPSSHLDLSLSYFGANIRSQELRVQSRWVADVTNSRICNNTSGIRKKELERGWRSDIRLDPQIVSKVVILSAYVLDLVQWGCPMNQVWQLVEIHESSNLLANETANKRHESSSQVLGEIREDIQRTNRGFHLIIRSRWNNIREYLWGPKNNQS